MFSFYVSSFLRLIVSIVLLVQRKKLSIKGKLAELYNKTFSFSNSVHDVEFGPHSDLVCDVGIFSFVDSLHRKNTAHHPLDTSFTLCRHL